MYIYTHTQPDVTGGVAGIAKALTKNGNEEKPVVDPPSPPAGGEGRPKVGGATAAAPSTSPVTAAAPPKVAIPSPFAKKPAPAPGASATIKPKPSSPPPAPKPPKGPKPLDVDRLKEEIATAVGGTLTGFIVGRVLEAQAAATSDEATLTAASGATVLGLGKLIYLKFFISFLLLKTPVY